MKSLLTALLITIFLSGHSQTKDQFYGKAFKEQSQMLTGIVPVNFKRAVFLTEDAYSAGRLNYQSYCQSINGIAVLLQEMIRTKGISRFHTAGNWATFSFMTDSNAANHFKPFTYDFNDFTGAKDWTNMFVTKLLKTHGGNCHSLPYLYKILCEEVGASAFLALAPNHIYIKHLDEKNQWTNVELTNPGFPRDQWIIKEMAISVEAIKKNIYMAPLTTKQSIAMTMFDLAAGYKAKYGYDSFVLQVTNTALKYFPNAVPIIQFKANCLLTMIKSEQKRGIPDSVRLLAQISQHKKTMATVAALGYKDMPVELYEQWVRSVEKEKQKRTNLNR